MQAEPRHITCVESPFAHRACGVGADAGKTGEPSGIERPLTPGGPEQPEAAETPSLPDAQPATTVTRSLSAPRALRIGLRPPRRLVGLRALTGYEEQIVEERGLLSNSARLCNEILARCICAPGQEPGEARDRVGELLVAERDSALIELRRLTFGSRVDNTLRCPQCGMANPMSFDLALVTLDVTDVAEGVEVTLTDGRAATLRLPTARDQADLLDAGLGSIAERRTWILERAICKLEGKPGPLGFEVVHALDTRARLELDQELDRAVPDLDLSVGATCQECGQEFSAPFEVSSFFLQR